MVFKMLSLFFLGTSALKLRIGKDLHAPPKPLAKDGGIDGGGSSDAPLVVEKNQTDPLVQGGEEEALNDA